MCVCHSTYFPCQQMDNEELLKSMIELVKLDMDWTPKAPDCSLYIRPTMIGTNVSQHVYVCDCHHTALTMLLVDFL